MEPANKELPLVLICDDSIIARNSLKNMLLNENCIIEFAIDGIDSLKKISDLNPDLVLLDLLMPGMSGMEVLENLKKLDISVPIVVISADVQNSTKKLCTDLGAIDFLNKPPKIHDVISTFRRITNKNREL